MDVNALFDVMERLIEESKVAILANVDQQGRPRMRWMSPAVIRGQSGCLYALTAPDFAKTSQLQQQPAVEWMIQGPALREMLRVRGTVELIDNPALKSDVLEALGGKLGAFWRSNPDPSNMIVLETIIEELVYYQPMKDQRHEVRVDR